MKGISYAQKKELKVAGWFQLVGRTAETVPASLMLSLPKHSLTCRTVSAPTPHFPPQHVTEELALTTTISLPFALLKAFVHLTFLGFLFILKFLWHLLEQNLKHFASFLTNIVPWPGYTLTEQK